MAVLETIRVKFGIVITALIAVALLSEILAFLKKNPATIYLIPGLLPLVPGSGMFQTATAAIVVTLDSSLTDMWMADGSIAAAHILLAAADLGLGACWCQVYQRDGAQELIKNLCVIPEDKTVLCVISLGYKDEERKQYDLEKLNYAKIHNEQW